MKLSVIARWLFLATVLLAGALWLSIPDVRPLRDKPPGETAFMRLRREQAEDLKKKYRPRKTWVPITAISPALQRAVIVSEDGDFYGHGGIDVNEIKASVIRDVKTFRLSRGGSTITQQLAKNLYLSPSKNPIRKVRELLIARQFEAHLSKNRILELYLNSIEWGDGIFGAEAAARSYFSVSARSLSQEQAALLAAIIPNPRRLGKQLTSRRVQKKKKLILRRMRAGKNFAPVKVELAEELQEAEEPETPEEFEDQEEMLGPHWEAPANVTAPGVALPPSDKE